MSKIINASRPLLLNNFLVLLVLLGFFSFNFISAKPVNALACGTDAQCEAAKQRCIDRNLTWNDTAGTCDTGFEGPSTPTPPSPTGDNIVVEGAGDNIFALLQTIVNLLYAVIAFVIIGVIITAGIQYSASGGNPQAAGEAKKKINSAILALVVLALLYPFLQFIVLGRAFNN